MAILANSLVVGNCAYPASQGAWSPEDLGASLLAWWTADRTDLLALSGAQVVTWNDVVSGHEAEQAVSAARPLYSATSFNGAPGLSFDGVDDELTLTPAPALFPDGAEPSEFWALTQQNALPADTGTRHSVAYGGTITTERRQRRAVVGGVNRGGNVVGTGGSNTSFSELETDLSGRHVLRSIFGASETSFSVDGNPPASVAATPATALTRMRMGATASTSASGFWNGVHRDIIVTLPLSTDEADALTTYLLGRRMP